MAWKTPKTDWTANPKSPDPSDFNRIEGNIDFLKQDIETKKGLIVDAINDMNQPAEVTDTHAQLAGKIRDISKDADASVDNVLSGKTFYQGGGKKTGTMPNRAGDTEALAISRSGTTLKLRAPKGFYDGIDDNVTYNEPNWIAANIPVGISMFGLTGSNANKKWAEGTVNSNTLSFRYLRNIITNLNVYGAFLTINGLSFTPSRVFITFEFDTAPPYRLMAANIAGVNTGMHQREYKYNGASSGLRYSHLGTFYEFISLSQNPEICIFQVNAASNPLVASDFANIHWYAYE